MSVQVRRRREAASFLSTYVGAQGELLVDTTNNRVQVHDGITPGGWPAARIGDLPGGNAVINGTFAINQRGYASGASLAAGVYAHDRWKAGSGGCTYTFAQTVPDTTITVTAGSLIQTVEGSNVTATSYWLMWTGTATARVYQGSASSQTSPAYANGTSANIGGTLVNALLVSGLAPGTVVNLEFAAGTIGLVQFEAALPNVGPTRYGRRQIAIELALCQRYYWVSSALSGGFGQKALATVAFTFPVTMRVAPTLTILNGSINGGSALELAVAGHVVTSIATGIINTSGGRNDFNIASQAQSAQIPCILEAGTLGFSAEL